MEDDQNLEQEIERIVEEIKRKIGVTIPSLIAPSSTYKCEKCRDTGWIEWKDDEGRTIVKKCACQLAKEAQAKLISSGLADVVSLQTFDSFKTDTPIQKKMKEVAQKYLDALLSFPDNPRKPWMYIGGNPGSGKTHICTAVCGELLKHNIGVRYMQWLNEARKLKSSVNDEDFEEVASEFIDPPVLYIDDLLKQKYVDSPVFSEADIKIAFTILNARYLMNKPTIISSEWGLTTQLLDADEGVFSRVFERCNGFIIKISRDTRNNYRLNHGYGWTGVADG